MAVNYDYYRIFYYVARYKSFTQAAKILLNNQPNITRAMNNLEHELGCRLFVRSNRGIALTPEGEKLYDHVAIAYEQLAAGEAEVLSSTSLQSGILSIGCSASALHGILMSKLEAFHDAYPGVKLHISNYSTPQAVTALKNGIVDFAVVTTPADIPKPLLEIPLKSYCESPVGGPKYKALSGRAISLKEMLQYPFICLSPFTQTFSLYSQFFLSHGLTMEPDIEAASAGEILPLIKHNLGIGFLPDFFVKEPVERGEIFYLNLKEKLPTRCISLVKDTRKPLSTAAREFERVLCQTALLDR